jgi:hypothetical protein
MDMDIELASESGIGRRFGKVLGVLVGLVALAAAVFATVETAANKGGERAQFMASRLSVDLYGRQTVSQVFADAQAAVTQEARDAATEAAARRTQATAQGETAAALAEADAAVRAAARVGALATSVGSLPGPGSGVDAPTRAALGATPDALEAVQSRLTAQLALAKRFGQRRSRAVFSLSLAALAAVLVGLAAVVGAERGGWMSLALATGALVLSVGWGLSAAFG